MESACSRDAWEAAVHLELELERAERTIDFGVILTKMQVKALGMNEVSRSGGMERKEHRMKRPSGRIERKATEKECPRQ